ncbi:hypothetical protein NTGBS_200081 [Candidatus Nitrotoga sp. BS]|uniref:hypothetical protein n=1 Tax=Candidatus Nitrotoga sp. BS TaxID=2890408 RepID=UPI001EF18DEF|nr:hypothetical protein [Candidatus Nitrotoga sp. BS]CAH1196098.1 hypothetical protein NTGBS_200081 [Candidatus Nitrotoga sp. BS]
MNRLPETGFPRLTQIIGNPKAEPPIPAVIPASKSTWWEGVRTGHYRDLRATHVTMHTSVEIIRFCMG